MTSESFINTGNSSGNLLVGEPMVNSMGGLNGMVGDMSISMLKISNIPSDLTQREATTIFSLVIDDIVNIEIKDFMVLAYFKNYQTCLTTGKLLDGKYIFGKEYAPIKIDYDQVINSPNSMPSAGLNSNFNNLRLSQSLQPPQSQQQQSQADFQKRQLIGNQRSRFLFSDPFLGSTTPNQQSSSNQPHPSIDLSDLTGKSILLMDSPQDGTSNNNNNIARDPWNSQLPINNSAPQTPGASSLAHTPFEWNSSQSQPQTQPQSQPQSQQLQSGSNDRRRTSSAFFNNNLMPTLNPNLPLNSINSISLPQANQQPTQPSSQPSSQTSSQPSSQPPSQSANQQPASQQGSSTQLSPSSGQTTPTNKSKDVPDLSLLARVPPPANPADQNPPCNTLYVGNLPPDATELELRALFSPQKGFRRLSFRTKNQSLSNPNQSSNHNHGPMCFVEFEDVAHATRALAELYGRTLPRSGGSNGKGGIRLSFSKNPLGVRGPGNPRRASNNQVSTCSTSSSSNSNGIGNYGYLNYSK